MHVVPGAGPPVGGVTCRLCWEAAEVAAETRRIGGSLDSSDRLFFAEELSELRGRLLRAARAAGQRRASLAPSGRNP